MANSHGFNSRELTTLLRLELKKAHDIATESGGIITKAEVLTELLMKTAIGWEEVVLKEEESGKVVELTIKHKPQPWAIQLIWDRTEGKSPQSIPDVKSGITAAEKVRELTVARVNELSQQAIGAKLSGPPTYKGNRKDGRSSK